MPTRFIKESCRSSKNLDAVTDFEERLFWRLLTTADDFGRFLADPELVRSACFPRRDRLPIQKLVDALAGLTRHHLIILYSVKDRQYGQFCTFNEHQGKPRSRKSKYPAPLDTSLHADASRCTQMHADALGHPDTDTDTNTDLNSLPLVLSYSDESVIETFDGIAARIKYPSSHENDEFETFWNAYPRKVGKTAAQKAFQNAHNRPRIDDLLLAIGRARASPQWAKEGGQFIPHPSTWLNQGRWDDQLPEIESPMQAQARAFLGRG